MSYEKKREVFVYQQENRIAVATEIILRQVCVIELIAPTLSVAGYTEISNADLMPDSLPIPSELTFLG
jgi:hypothetical protein